MLAREWSLGRSFPLAVVVGCAAFAAGVFWGRLDPDREWLALAGLAYAGYLLTLVVTGQIRVPRRLRLPGRALQQEEEPAPWAAIPGAAHAPELAPERLAEKVVRREAAPPPSAPTLEELAPPPPARRERRQSLLPEARRVLRLEGLVAPQPLLLDPYASRPLAEAVRSSSVACVHYQAPPRVGKTALVAGMLSDPEVERVWQAMYYRSVASDDDPSVVVADLCHFLADNGDREPLRDLCFFALPLERVVESLATCLQSKPYLIVLDNLQALGAGDGPEAGAIYRMVAGLVRPGALSRIVTVTSDPQPPDLPVWLVRRLGAVVPPSAGDVVSRLPRLSAQPLSVHTHLAQIGSTDLLRYRLLDGLASRSVILDLPELFGDHAEPTEMILRALFERLSEDEAALAARIARCERALSGVEIEHLGGRAGMAEDLAAMGLLDGSAAQGRWLMHSFVREVVQRLSSREGPLAHRALAGLEEMRDPVRAYSHLLAARDYNTAMDLIAAASYRLMMGGLSGHLQKVFEGCLERPLGGWSRYVLYHLLGNMLERTGQWDEATLAYEGQIGVAASLGSPRHRAIAWHSMGTVLVNLGDFDQAQQEFARARAVFAAVDDSASLAMLLNNLGVLHRLRQEWDKALDCYQRAIPLKEEIGAPGPLARALHNVRLASAARGDERGAVEAARRLREIVAQTPALEDGLYGCEGLAYQLSAGQKVETEICEKGMELGRAPRNVLTPLRRRFDALLGRLGIEQPEVVEPLLRAYSAEARRLGALDLALRAEGAAAYAVLTQHRVDEAVDRLLSAAEEALDFDRALHYDLCNYLRQIIQRAVRSNPEHAERMRARIRERWPAYVDRADIGPLEAGPPPSIEPAD